MAPFRFPKTDCGLLFARTLEESEPEGVASPFDSGGLANVFQLPDPSESKLSFLIRHELPSPDHRSYLKRRMELLFKTPEGYVEGDDLDRACCIGLTGGDIRRWTHEVRIPDRVELRNRHLAAVFVSSLARSTGVETFLKWCLRNSIEVIPVAASRAGGFEELKKACILYIQRTLY